MFRLSALLWAGAAIGVGLFLYQVKHEVQGLEQQLTRANRDIAAAHERIHVLHAEWSLLNEPERLSRLAARHLDLVPMRPAQFTGTETIAALPVAAPDEPAIAQAEPPAPAPAPAVAAVRAVPPVQPSPREARTAAPAATSRVQPPPPPRHAAPGAVPGSAPTPRRELEAANRPATVPAAAPRQLLPTAPQQRNEAVVTVNVAVPPQPAGIAPLRPANAQGSGSALGGPAVALPPPVPRRVNGGPQ